MRSRTRWRSASSRTCSSTKSRSTSSHAERPQRRPALAHRAPAAPLAQAGVPGVPAAAHRGVQEHAVPGGTAGNRRRGGARAGSELGRSVSPHRGAAARARRPDHRAAAAVARVPALAHEAPRPAGVHVVLPTAPAAREVIPLAPEALQALYGDWHVTRRRRTNAGAGFTATKPERQADTAANVSD